MIVFEYFYEKMDVFAPLMNEWITKLYHQDHEQDNDLLEVIQVYLDTVTRCKLNLCIIIG